MESTSENKPIKHTEHISIGLLAHVDAGKTTLAESMLYLSGKLKKRTWHNYIFKAGGVDNSR